MKTIIKYFLLVCLVIITFKTYKKSQTNDKDLWYNVGESSKELVTDIVGKSKPIVQSIKKGFENK